MRDDADTEERAIYVFIALVLLPVIAPVLWTHAVFDTGSTIALLGVCGVLVALVQHRRRPAPVPPARVRRARVRLFARVHAWGDRRRARRAASALLGLGGLLVATAAAHAEPPAVVVSGYVEGYYQLHAQAPDNRVTALRGFDSRSLTFTLSNAVLDARATSGRVTTHLALQVGATGAAYYAADPPLDGAGGASASGPTRWEHLQTATIGVQAGASLVEAGLFPSPIGPEVFAVKDNHNWSRSSLFVALPYYHTGVRASRPLVGAWTATLAVYNGWNSLVDNNPWPSVAVSASHASGGTTAQVLYFGGIERADGAPEGRAWRHLADLTVQHAVTPRVTVAAHADAGLERTDIGTSAWAAGALYARATLGPCVYVAARVDHIRERTDGATPILIPVRWVGAGTLTVAYQPADPISVRLEVRQDHASSDAYFSGEVATDPTTQLAVPDHRTQDTVTLGATAWF